MKKSLLILLPLFALFGVFFYFSSWNSKNKDSKNNVKINRKEYQENSKKKIVKKTQEKKITSRKKTKNTISQKNLKKLREEADKSSEEDGLDKEKGEKIRDLFISNIKANWLKEVNYIFKEKFGLPDSVYEEFVELREEFLQVRNDSYKRYQEKMKGLYGENYLTDSRKEIYINESYSEYRDALEGLIGSDNLEAYFKFKSDYNESIEDIVDDELELAFIEY